MKKLFLKKVAASVVALLTLVSSGIVWTGSAAVSAADPQPITELKILKKLKLPAGVKTPTKTFSFNFKPYSFNDKPEEKNSLPDLGSATVAYPEGVNNVGDTINKDAVLNLKNINWGKPGQFTYEIEEAEITPANSTDYEEKWTKSPAKYLISFFVAKIGTATKVSKIFIKRTEPDTNDGTNSPKEEAKVEYNPNPGPNQENGLKFTNIYNKKVKPITPPGGGQTPPSEDQMKKGLRIKKEAQGSDLYKAQEFDFKVTITKPNTVADKDVGKITYYCTSGVKTENNNYGDITFKLKNGQFGVFSNVWLGSKVVVEETDAQGGGTPEIEGVANGIAIKADGNHSFKTTEFTLGEDDNGNYVLYKNKEQAATGVLLDNLPFILIALLAVIGIFFFFKNRKRKQDQAQHHF